SDRLVAGRRIGPVDWAETGASGQGTEALMATALDRDRRRAGGRGGDLARRDLVALAALGLLRAPGIAKAAVPGGQVSRCIHVSLAPAWFDPAETQGLITPFMVLYALHDAMVKPMPDRALAPCLAESYAAAEDGLSYDFVLRRGVRFHNGDPVIAEDVKFSF